MYQTKRSQRAFTGHVSTGKLTKDDRVQYVGKKKIVHTKERLRDKGYKKIMNLHFNFLHRAGIQFEKPII